MYAFLPVMSASSGAEGPQNHKQICHPRIKHTLSLLSTSHVGFIETEGG